MSDYKDCWFSRANGLRLYARDYPCQRAAHTLLCLHGLTRNSADFADLASSLCDRYRLLAVDQRGRGRSEHDPTPENYKISTYVADTIDFLDHQAPANVVLIGTSMGGIMAMVMASRQPERFHGIVLNDIGPIVESAGVARIQSYVGKRTNITSWSDAAAATRANLGVAFPDWDEEQWREYAHKIFVENADGLPEFAYDPNISQPMPEDQANAVPADLWPVFDKLVHIPMLVIRGEISDILSSATVAEMRQRHPNLRHVEVPNRGHAPTLEEPAARSAITDFLQGLG